jgi:hypothetical protein
MTLKEFKSIIKSLEDDGKVNDDTKVCIYIDEFNELVELGSSNLLGNIQDYIDELIDKKNYYSNIYRFNPELLSKKLFEIDSTIRKYESLGKFAIILNNQYDA